MSNKKRKQTILIDKIIGEPIFNFLTFFKSNKKVQIDKKEIKNILFIRPGGIGDYLLNIPAFKEVRKEFPKAKITLFIFKRNKFCLEFYNNFDKVVQIDNKKELLSYIFSKKNYNLTIDFDQHRKIPAILTLLSKARIRIGFRNNKKEKAYNFPVSYSKSKYEAQSFLDLLKPLSINRKIKEEDLILIDNKNKDKNSIGIYACAMKENNRLSIDKWVKIIDKLGKDKDYYFIGSKEDKARYDQLQKQLKEGFNILRYDGKTSLKECLKLISKLRLLVSEDGGVYHFAVCTKTPTLSYWLHGKDNMNKWKAPFSKHKGVLLR